jgi:predicted ester cyclase
VDSKKVVKEFWASYGRGNLDATWEAYVADDIVIHSPAGYELDRESWLVDEKALWAAFEDIEAKVLDQVAEGDMVASRWSLSGRQTAEFMGVSSRGGTATLTGILFDRIRDDKIAEHWAEVGLSHFLQVLSAA